MPMLSPREISVSRALLAALAAVPADCQLSEATLHADAARGCHPRATTEELEAGLAYLAVKGRAAHLATETGMLWEITSAGRLWRKQNP